MSFNLLEANQALHDFILALKEHGCPLVVWDQQEGKHREVVASMISLDRDKIILVARFTDEERKRGELKTCQN